MSNHEKLRLKGRFLVFSVAQFYPSGGEQDLVGSFATLEEAEKVRAEEGAQVYGCAYIVELEMDPETMVVAR